MRSKKQREVLPKAYTPRDPAAPCAVCEQDLWFRQLPDGDWRCAHCNPYGLMEAKMNRWETFKCKGYKRRTSA